MTDTRIHLGQVVMSQGQVPMKGTVIGFGELVGWIKVEWSNGETWDEDPSDVTPWPSDLARDGKDH